MNCCDIEDADAELCECCSAEWERQCADAERDNQFEFSKGQGL